MAKALRRLALLIALPALLAGCAAESIWAQEEEVQASIYRHNGPPALALFTMINNRSQSGAHSALLVNGSQRVVFNPAGTYNHPQTPERNDVHYGMTDKAVDFFIDYHARETYHVVKQEIVVTPQQAEIALRLVQNYGAVPPAACTTSITNILRQVPGFENFAGGVFPTRAMNAMATYPGVVTTKHFDNSPDDRGDLIVAPNVR